MKELQKVLTRTASISLIGIALACCGGIVSNCEGKVIGKEYEPERKIYVPSGLILVPTTDDEDFLITLENCASGNCFQSSYKLDRQDWEMINIGDNVDMCK